MNGAVVTSSNRANRGDDSVLVCGFDISVGTWITELLSDEMVGIQDGGGLTRC